MDKYIAFIPVRGGSKSIPMKNIKPICGYPLVYWVLNAATNCNIIDKVYVSTDSDEIKRVITEYKQSEICCNKDKIECVNRSPFTATDVASTESAMLDFAKQYEFKNIILIQATSPLLTSNDLYSAIEKYEQNKYDSMLSVVRQKRFVWENRGVNCFPSNYDYKERPRRQEFDGFLVENGAFYITEREALMKDKCRLTGSIGAYEMADESYFEIDEMQDWAIMENLLKQRKMNFHRGKIKLFATDCDGVLTDGGMYYSDVGDIMKKFNTKDGMGFELLKKANIKTAIITGEETEVVSKRAEKMNVDYLFMGIKNKHKVLLDIAKQEQLRLSEIAYMGDDINDIECLNDSAIGITVPNAVEEVKRLADLVVKTKGGEGAFREAVEYILNFNA